MKKCGVFSVVSRFYITRKFVTPFSTFHATNTDTARLTWRKRNRSIDTAIATTAEEAATVYRATGRSVSLVYAIHTVCLCICASLLFNALAVNVARTRRKKRSSSWSHTHMKAFAMFDTKCSIWWIISEKQSFKTEWFSEFRDNSNDTRSIRLQQLWIFLATIDFWLMSFSCNFSLEHLTNSMHNDTSNTACALLFFLLLLLLLLLISFSLLLIVSVFVVADDLSALSGIFHAMSFFSCIWFLCTRKLNLSLLVLCAANTGMSLGGKWQTHEKMMKCEKHTKKKTWRKEKSNNLNSWRHFIQVDIGIIC